MSLLPFPSAEAASALPLLSRRTAAGDAPLVRDALSAITAAPSAIVSTAAGILDEEMARGVIAAKNAAPAIGGRELDPSNVLLRQVHDVVDNIARLWSSMPASVATRDTRDTGTRYESSVGAGEPIPQLKPPAAVRPGDRATISMTVSNDESRPVRLVPSATALLGSNGERLAPQLVEFAPTQLALDPGQKQDLVVTIAVPPLCRRGCYSGLLVVSGVDYLRAVITIEVGPPQDR